jgi:cell division protein FtsQ
MVSAVWEQRGFAGAPRRFGRATVVVLVLALVLAGTLVAADRLLQPDAFPVQRVSFEGPFHRVKPAELRAAVAGAIKGNFFSLDLASVEAAARRVPWVDRVSVRREWPRAIHIQYTEYQLAAHWGEHGWLTADGKVVELPAGGAETGLPHLDGPAGSENAVMSWYRKMSAAVKSVQLHVSSLEETPRRSWVAVMAPPGTADRGGFRVVLGRDRIAQRLERFVHIYPGVLAPRASAIARVDLRYPNGFAVAWRAGADPASTTVHNKRLTDDKKGG